MTDRISYAKQDGVGEPKFVDFAFEVTCPLPAVPV